MDLFTIDEESANKSQKYWLDVLLKPNFLLDEKRSKKIGTKQKIFLKRQEETFPNKKKKLCFVFSNKKTVEIEV